MESNFDFLKYPSSFLLPVRYYDLFKNSQFRNTIEIRLKDAFVSNLMLPVEQKITHWLKRKSTATLTLEVAQSLQIEPASVPLDTPPSLVLATAYPSLIHIYPIHSYLEKSIAWVHWKLGLDLAKWVNPETQATLEQALNLWNDPTINLSVFADKKWILKDIPEGTIITPLNPDGLEFMLENGTVSLGENWSNFKSGFNKFSCQTWEFRGKLAAGGYTNAKKLSLESLFNPLEEYPELFTTDRDGKVWIKAEVFSLVLATFTQIAPDSYCEQLESFIELWQNSFASALQPLANAYWFVQKKLAVLEVLFQNFSYISPHQEQLYRTLTTLEQELTPNPILLADISAIASKMPDTVQLQTSLYPENSKDTSSEDILASTDYKALRKIVEFAGFNLELFQISSGDYYASLSSAATPMEKEAQSLNNFVESKIIKSLLSERCGLAKVVKITPPGSKESIRAVPLEIVSLYWLRQYELGNPLAKTLVTEICLELLTQVANQAFIVKLSEQEQQQNLRKQLENYSSIVEVNKHSELESTFCKAINYLLQQLNRLEGTTPEYFSSNGQSNDQSSIKSESDRTLSQTPSNGSIH